MANWYGTAIAKTPTGTQFWSIPAKLHIIFYQRASEDRGLWQRMVANVVDDGTAT